MRPRQQSVGRVVCLVPSKYHPHLWIPSPKNGGLSVRPSLVWRKGQLLEQLQNLKLLCKTQEQIMQFFFSSENDLLYVIEVTYRTVGVKLVGMACYGARFVVLKHPPPLFLSDWLSRLNFGRGTKIFPRRVILYNTLYSLSPRNPRIISYSLRVDARSSQHNVTVKLYCEHHDSSLGLFVVCIL